MPLAMTSVHTKIPLRCQWETLEDVSYALSYTLTVHSHQIVPFQGPKVRKDLVAFVFHLAVDAVDGDLLDQRLQRAAVVLHARTRTADETSIYGFRS